MSWESEYQKWRSDTGLPEQEVKSKPELIRQPLIEELNEQPYERYLPNAFDGSLSIVEKLNKIIHNLNEMNIISIDLVNKWNDFVKQINEGLIDNKIRELLQDKNLLKLMDEELLTDFKKDINYLLDEMLQKDDIIHMPNIGQDIREFMTKGVLPVVGVGSVNSVNVVKDGITPNNASFVRVQDGVKLNDFVYTAINSSAWQKSILPVTNYQPGETYTLVFDNVINHVDNLVAGLYVYDSENTVLVTSMIYKTGDKPLYNTITIPTNAVKIEINLYAANGSPLPKDTVVYWLGIRWIKGMDQRYILKNNILVSDENFTDSLNQKFLLEVDMTNGKWEQGTINSQGKFANANNRICVKEFFKVDRNITLNMNPGYQIGYAYYSQPDENTLIKNEGWKTVETKVTINKDYYYRFYAAKTNSSDLIVDDSVNIHVFINQVLKDGIEKNSLEINNLSKKLDTITQVNENNNPNPTVFGIAHMLGSNYGPPNTLLALKNAKKKGYHYGEFDVMKTRDNHFVLCHDRTIENVSNGAGAIAEMTLEQLKSYDFGIKFSPEYAGEKIPTLEETFSMMKKLSVTPVIEIKYEASYEDIQNMLLIAKRYGVFKDSVWVCYYDEQHVYLNQLLNNHRQGVEIFGDLNTWEQTRTKIQAVTNNKPVLICDTPFLVANATNIANEFPDMEVFTFTVNDAQSLLWVLNTPVTGIVTNGIDIQKILETNAYNS